MRPNLIRNFRFEISDFRSSLLRPAGLLLILATTSAFATVRYVNVNNANPASPYTGWATAAQTIQDAVDVAVAGDEIVVTNGIYATGGRALVGTMTNRVAVDKALTLRSLNGPQFTSIQGYQVPGSTNGDGAIRCVALTNGSSLIGFTLTNGATRTTNDYVYYAESSGGGVWCAGYHAIVSNCFLTGNSANHDGGGAYSVKLYGCILQGNTAGFAGGGAADCELIDCILVGNSAQNGGGACYAEFGNDCLLSDCLLINNRAANGGGAFGCKMTNCTVAGNSAVQSGGGVGGFAVQGAHRLAYLYNCIVYSNTAAIGPNYADPYCFFDHSCTFPSSTWAGSGNITNPPLFLDFAAGNLRLQSNSPCLNAGNNSYVVGSADLDGRPRIVGGTVDIGAYEFQPDTSGAFIAWLAQYGLPTDGSADYTDPDADGRNNWQEWRCQTNPTNAASALRMVSALRTGANVSVTWQSVAGVTYFLERNTNLMAVPPFVPVAMNVPGQAGTTSYLDSGAAGARSIFYRVGVGN